MAQTTDYKLEGGENAREVPVRLQVVQEDQSPVVHESEETWVMTFPHLILRELLALVSLSVVLVLISLLMNAPLEELANPEITPNPAKAPWYFLGLQELLHYYPPFISGVLLPGLFVVALIVVPYFNVNLERSPFWQTNRKKKVMGLGITIVVLTLIFAVTGAHPVWPVIIPLWITGLIMFWPLISKKSSPWRDWIATRSLSFWVFAFFLIVSVVLTVIGIFFRGPGWAWILPWRDGIYY